MGILSIVIKKVAEQASKVVLFGALVGGVSLASYATETPVGPTIEKAQLETVDINLDAVVAALTVIDPAWAESLPKVKTAKKVGKEVEEKMFTDIRGVLRYEPGVFPDPGKYYLTPYSVTPTEGDCADEGIPCKIEINLNDIEEDGDELYIFEGQEVQEVTPNGPFVEL